MPSKFVLTGIFFIMLTGCGTEQLCCDQEKIRATLLELYTNQIMDNLIRASNRMPIIQVDYGGAAATVTTKDSATFSDALATTHSNVVTAAVTKTVANTSMFVTTIMGSGTADRTNQVAVTATPVIATDDVYDAYTDFLALPGSLRVTCDPPPAGAAHICRQRDHVYYWVPMEFQKAFLNLALVTTAQRAATLPAPDPFYSVNIVAVVGYKWENPSAPADDKNGGADAVLPKKDADAGQGKNAMPPQPPKVYTVLVKTDKRIPNDNGRIDLNGSKSNTGGANSSATPSGTGQTTPKGGARLGAPIGTGFAHVGFAENQAAPVSPAPKPATGLPQGVFEIAEYNPDGSPRLKMVDMFYMYVVGESSLPQGIASLDALAASVPIAAKVYLRGHRPQAPTANDPLNRIEFQLQQIEFNQIRLGGGL
jgi:hypothetical protein